MPGVYLADIGRIASKHVKVTVSHKGSSSRPVTSSNNKSIGNNMMRQNHAQNEVENTPLGKTDVEEMDTRDGKLCSVFTVPG